MNSDLTKKTCRMCCMEIPKEARKCPHCHHFQNRVSLLFFHPAFLAFFVMIPFICMLIFFTQIFDQGENYENYKNQIVIPESQLSFGDTKSSATVAVLGTIKNTSSISWKDVQFHVDFFDASGKRADVGEREDYSFCLFANETSSFKVSFRREFPETNYVKHHLAETFWRREGLRQTKVRRQYLGFFS